MFIEIIRFLDFQLRPPHGSFRHIASNQRKSPYFRAKNGKKGLHPNFWTMCIDTTGALDCHRPQRGYARPPFGCCRESVFTMLAMHTPFFIFSSSNLSIKDKGFRTSETAKPEKQKTGLRMVTRLIKDNRRRWLSNGQKINT